MNIQSPYNGSLTREQFLFHEMRITARLMSQGLSDKEIIDTIIGENLFQFPTERTIKQQVKCCILRLHAMNNETLVRAIAEQPFEDAKQICLFAIMKQNRLVWDFMITVIGAKYQRQDYTYKRSDITSFLMQLQEQDDNVASWSETTIKKISAVLSRLLIENEYIDDAKATRLNPVLICRVLENELRDGGEQIALSAFNCLN